MQPPRAVAERDVGVPAEGIAAQLGELGKFD
jgi:hypothetical protein